MKRRQFIAASIAASAATLTGDAAAQAPAGLSSGPPREFYQIRRYSLKSGLQLALTESYFSDALMPALTRMGMGPIGAFKLDIGPETPAYYLLIPGSSLEALALLDQHLSMNTDFLKAAGLFWNATATAPSFQRVEISLLAAFAGWPKLTTSASSATKAKRIFQLRTYESPSNGEHVRKVEMFHSGEFEIFEKAGFSPGVFRRHSDWLSDAKFDLHAELCRPGGAGCEMGRLSQRSSMEEALRQSSLQL